jgi:hypothetical protein
MIVEVHGNVFRKEYIEIVIWREIDPCCGVFGAHDCAEGLEVA